MNALDFCREDYLRFLAEYGLHETAVRFVVEDMSDHIDMPEGFGKFEIRASPLQGVGLICVEPIKAGEVIAPARIGRRRTLAGRRTNHSPMANCRFAAVPSGLLMVAKRAIEPGAELTIDYREVAKVNGWNLAPDPEEVLATRRWYQAVAGTPRVARVSIG